MYENYATYGDLCYTILKISKFSTISSANQPASLPAVRPGSTSALAPDFSSKKGNRI